MPEANLHIHRFDPPGYLALKNPSSHKLKNMESKVLDILRRPKREPVDIRALSRLHPLIRNRLLPTHVREGLKMQLKELRSSRDLLKMGFSPAHLVPATVDSRQVFERPPRTSVINVVFDHPELPPDSPKLIALLHVTRLNDDRYSIDAYGMQGSPPKKKFPAGVRRFYYTGAPALALALGAEALRRGGAKQVYVSGMRLADFRKSYKSDAIKAEISELLETADHRVPVAGRTVLKRALNDWDRLSESALEKMLSPFPAISTLTFSPALREHYYGERGVLRQFKKNIAIVKHPGFGKFQMYRLRLRQFKPLRPFLQEKAQ